MAPSTGRTPSVTAELPDCEELGLPLPLPLPEPPPLLFPPPLPPVEGAVGVKVVSPAKHELTALSTSVREAGALLLTDALPWKEQEAALRLVAS
jgi:hypothetical protein